MLRARRALTLSAISVFAACATERGYSGPELPPERISSIAVHTTGEVSVSAVRVDGHELGAFSTAVDVPAGEHRLELRYETERESCQPGEYFCDVTTVSGLCEGKLTTLGGRAYLVTVEGKLTGVDIRLSPKGYFDFSNREDEPSVGYASCRELSQRSTYRRRTK